MASNRHFSIDLKALAVREVEAPSLESLLELADLPSHRTPFANNIKRGRYVTSYGRRWFLDAQLCDYNYQVNGYSSDVSKFSVDFTFDVALEITDLNRDRFLYSMSRRIVETNWRMHRQKAGSYFEMGQLQKGSIRGQVLVGLVSLGTFASYYHDMKTGFVEMLSDAQFIESQIAVAVRAAKIPWPGETDPERHSPEIWVKEEEKQDSSPKRVQIRRED